MRHKMLGRKLGVKSKHRKAMFRNITTELFRYDSVRTTDTRAKEIKRVADKIISLAKSGSLHARRKAAGYIRDKEVLQKLFNELAERYKDRPGGYTRIIKLGYRKGDNAPVSLIELVQEEYKPKTKKKKTKTKAKSAKTEEIDSKKEQKQKSTKKESAKDLGLTEDTNKTEDIEASKESISDESEKKTEDMTAEVQNADTPEPEAAKTKDEKSEPPVVETEEKSDDTSDEEEKNK